MIIKKNNKYNFILEKCKIELIPFYVCSWTHHSKRQVGDFFRKDDTVTELEHLPCIIYLWFQTSSRCARLGQRTKTSVRDEAVKICNKCSGLFEKFILYRWWLYIFFQYSDIYKTIKYFADLLLFCFIGMYIICTGTY